MGTRLGVAMAPEHGAAHHTARSQDRDRKRAGKGTYTRKPA